MARHDAFRIDREYDREHGDEATGRYAAHVRYHQDEFADAWGDIAPVTFACVAWRLAVPPSLSPGYVRSHRRILDATCDRNAWDGGLTARVRLVSPLPAELTRSREWWRDRGWQGWPDLFGQYVDPSARDLAHRPYVRASILVEAPLPLDHLPPAPDGPTDELAATAARAVAALSRSLNDLLGPVLRQLDADPVDSTE